MLSVSPPPDEGGWVLIVTLPTFRALETGCSFENPDLAVASDIASLPSKKVSRSSANRKSSLLGESRSKEN